MSRITTCASITIKSSIHIGYSPVGSVARTPIFRVIRIDTIMVVEDSDLNDQGLRPAIVKPSSQPTATVIVRSADAGLTLPGGFLLTKPPHPLAMIMPALDQVERRGLFLR